MLVHELLDSLDTCFQDSLVQVEINGVRHDIHRALENSESLVLVVDLDEEEREMR